MSLSSTSSSPSNPADASDRQHWMSVLARAGAAAVSERMAALGELPSYQLLRPAEAGAVMVRGRAGGGGAPFNLGEMTVTRCSVRLTSGTVGHAYVQGRDRRHAELAAVADALMLDPQSDLPVRAAVVTPLAAALDAARELRSRKAASTKVEFFTLVRGDNVK